MAERLFIGALAARTGRSVHTIRWYESQGLIPGVERDAGGRRVYSELHLDWLDFMDRLRRTGMSIAQMRDYTALVEKGRTTLGERLELLRAHRGRVERTFTEWAAALELIDGKIGYYDEWLTTGHRPRSAVPRAQGAAPRMETRPRRSRETMS
jgi:DNA-binding transcriptional MerR regulator